MRGNPQNMRVMALNKNKKLAKHARNCHMDYTEETKRDEKIFHIRLPLSFLISPAVSTTLDETETELLCSDLRSAVSTSYLPLESYTVPRTSFHIIHPYSLQIRTSLVRLYHQFWSSTRPKHRWAVHNNRGCSTRSTGFFTLFFIWRSTQFLWGLLEKNQVAGEGWKMYCLWSSPTEWDRVKVFQFPELISSYGTGNRGWRIHTEVVYVYMHALSCRAEERVFGNTTYSIGSFEEKR